MNASPPHPPVILIAGPTATGKTELAIHIAETLGGEIISADSMQVYRGLAIGTAQPTPAETRGIPYHLIGRIEPHTPWTVADWLRQAKRLAAEIASRHRIPILAGGTGLYFKAFTDGLFEDNQAQRHPEIRARLDEQWRHDNGDALRRQLRKIDPEAFRRIHPNDQLRTVRALEIHEITGRPISAIQTEQRARHIPPHAWRFVLCAQRQELYQRIDRRVLQMIERGFQDEVHTLHHQGAHPDWPAMRALGYIPMLNLVRGQTTPRQAVQTTQHDSRRYAKQQIVLFRQWGNAVWLDTRRGIAKSIHAIQKTLEICPNGWF